ncbi:hypothetical protein JW756_05880 [Candidatus Woesearchaeota archaeon]|nr:hypothetical protein [Candidatus Woesearchaeota archaeon]
MIGNELEQEIISLYSKDISSLYSINQIASKLGKKYPYINKKVSFLIEQKIFKKTVIGRSYLCSLNLESEEAVYLLILNEIRKKESELAKDKGLQSVLEYINKIRKTASIRMVLKNRNNIIFVLDGKDDQEQFEKAVVKQAMQDYDVKIMTKEIFLKELLESKELQEKHIILYGYEKYYEYLREIEDELKLRYSKLIP